MPPCMGNTIAAVFLFLSAVSVKRFTAGLLLSALLQQRPEPVSDALPFGRYTMVRNEITFCTKGNFVHRVYFALKRRGLVDYYLSENNFPLFRLVRAKTRENT